MLLLLLRRISAVGLGSGNLCKVRNVLAELPECVGVVRRPHSRILQALQGRFRLGTFYFRDLARPLEAFVSLQERLALDLVDFALNAV